LKNKSIHLEDKTWRKNSNKSSGLGKPGTMRRVGGGGEKINVLTEKGKIKNIRILQGPEHLLGVTPPKGNG